MMNREKMVGFGEVMEIIGDGITKEHIEEAKENLKKIILHSRMASELKEGRPALEKYLAKAEWVIKHIKEMEAKYFYGNELPEDVEADDIVAVPPRTTVGVKFDIPASAFKDPAKMLNE